MLNCTENKTSFMKHVVGLSCRSNEMLNVSNFMPLRNEMGPKYCHPILTFIFITLNTKTATGKGSRILLLQSVKSGSRWHLRGSNVKLCILSNDKPEKSYSSISLWGRLTLEKTQKTRRELPEQIMKRDLQRQGAKNLWITFFLPFL